MWDPSSLTRDWTRALCIGSTRVLTTGLLGKSPVRSCLIQGYIPSTWHVVYTVHKFEWVWVVLFLDGSHLSPDAATFSWAESDQVAEVNSLPLHPQTFFWTTTGDIFFSHYKSPENTIHPVCFSLLLAWVPQLLKSVVGIWVPEALGEENAQNPGKIWSLPFGGCDWVKKTAHTENRLGRLPTQWVCCVD